MPIELYHFREIFLNKPTAMLLTLSFSLKGCASFVQEICYYDKWRAILTITVPRAISKS
jgi:hypothetical protein